MLAAGLLWCGGHFLLSCVTKGKPFDAHQTRFWRCDAQSISGISPTLY
jgi:hypothetical protein